MIVQLFNNRRPSWLVLLAALAGCEARNTAVPAATPTTEVAPVETSSPPPLPATPGPPATEQPRAAVVVGRLQLTKGAQPLVGGLLVAAENFEERFGPGWRTHLAGRRVRVTGRKDVHVCEPQEQCMSSGEIPQMLDVRMVEVCSSASLELAPLPRAVACPPSEAEVSACKSECDEQSRRCDSAAGSGPGPRRCGCARVSCFEGCAESAEADFRCH
jgi:hypothetical protein